MIAVSTLFSCHKKDCSVTPKPDYLIFGYSSCFCIQCCQFGYKIAGADLFKGEKDSQGTYVFETAPLDMAKYAIAKPLLDEFPDELLAENGKTYGCNGCFDQPVYYVEMKKGDTIYHWQIDSQTNGFPDYVKDYSAKLSDVLGKLQ